MLLSYCPLGGTVASSVHTSPLSDTISTSPPLFPVSNVFCLIRSRLDRSCHQTMQPQALYLRHLFFWSWEWIKPGGRACFYSEIQVKLMLSRCKAAKNCETWRDVRVWGCCLLQKTSQHIIWGMVKSQTSTRHEDRCRWSRAHTKPTCGCVLLLLFPLPPQKSAPVHFLKHICDSDRFTSTDCLDCECAGNISDFLFVYLQEAFITLQCICDSRQICTVRLTEGSVTTWGWCEHCVTSEGGSGWAVPGNPALGGLICSSVWGFFCTVVSSTLSSFLQLDLDAGEWSVVNKKNKTNKDREEKVIKKSAEWGKLVVAECILSGMCLCVHL